MQKILTHKFGLFFILLAFAMLNFLASVFHSKLDLTKEKRFTISKATKTALKGLNEKVEITVFLEGSLPSGFQKLANTTNDFLELLKENSSKITYKFVAPYADMEDADKKYQDTLVAMGATPINLTVQIKQGQEQRLIFPYAWAKYEDRTELINLYNGQSRLITQDEINGAEAMMEYKFLKVIDGFTSTQKPLVAYSFGNGEPTNYKTYDVLQALQKDYNLFTFDINKRAFIPDTFNVLMIVKPSLEFNEAEKLKIDQYLLRGGKVLCFIDNLNAEQDSLSLKPELVAYDRNLNLTDLLFKYGVRINTDLVMDLQCDFMPFAVGGTSDKPQFEFLHWNYYPLFESKNNHPINKNLGLVASRFVNSIDTVKANNVQKTILLSSSANSRKLGTPVIISLNENRNAPEDILFKQKDIPVAVLLEGNFTSLYKNRIAQNQLDSLQAAGMQFVAEGNGNGKMIVAADGDIVLNDASQKQGPLPMGMNLFTLGSQYEYQFANREFLLNCLEYLTNKQGIIEARNKEVVLRLLNTKQVEEQQLTWQVINIGLPIFVIVIMGFGYQQIRRKKYAA
ncbi:MAG TPA: gliding motility-associated ABC transporter substrate-binding protein GldG [Chitinophagaceae bacterium]|jgi:gliding-associated putative ABC transporter substrate-binding component GldG|nr:gliding motility-associated ABC transporter substrate-binding protein GldG [Chitinophagaceae bacterium]MBP9739138.1 gliding motility-associated ABC transporter substrate-binding protein GldG [Chitinophagaceae bacterium]HPH23662.1 gliding motility-associated ABC transporter substrate-binding protein GldG [Chitinophagaceae bacterium]